MKKLWNWFNGKKTIIGLGIVALCGQEFFTNHLNVDLVQALEWVGGILAGTGLLHKVAKKQDEKAANSL